MGSGFRGFGFEFLDRIYRINRIFLKMLTPAQGTGIPDSLPGSICIWKAPIKILSIL